jgi:kynureninase
MTLKYGASLDFAQSADETDPLRSFRARFAMPKDAQGRELLYFAGHSLGAMPLAVRDVLNEELDDWARFGVFGHEEARRPWIPYHESLTAGLCALTGALPNEVVAMGSLTANIHMMLASFYRPEGARRKILIEAGAFSSDRHAVTSQIEWHGLNPAVDLIELAPVAGEDLVPGSAIEACLAEQGERIALVLWPGVQFRTGQAFDLKRISAAAHRVGAMAGFDLAHSVGNTPLSLHDDDADFAMWCSYKYLNAGPGAIGGVFVHAKHVDTRPRLSGWWGHDATTRFQMKPEFLAHAGAAGWAVSNPSIFATAPLVASLALFQEAGVERLREKSVELTGYLEFLLDQLGSAVELITPRDPAHRGCQLSFRIVGAGRGVKVFRWLTANGVACDWREPDVIRASPIPLYNRFEDVFRFSEKLKQALESAY